MSRRKFAGWTALIGQGGAPVFAAGAFAFACNGTDATGARVAIDSDVHEQHQIELEKSEADRWKRR